MTTILATLFLGLLLAYANGANDNFKGVATLYGSGTTHYKKALYWATATTFLGSLAALVLAKGLLASFSGKGLVPDSVVALQNYSTSISLAAALTVLLATRWGLPVSTTHALIGALLGAGWLASPADVNWEKLVSAFFLPLAATPLLATAGTMMIYPVLRWARVRSAITKETCLCVGTETVASAPAGRGTDTLMLQTQTVVDFGTEATCVYSGAVFGANAQTILDAFHYLSAGIVSFARGLNDTPKIAALFLAGSTLPTELAIAGVALAILAGGLLSARKVAETLSHHVTPMNSGQGFTANIVTGIIVILASKLNLPVSTTHISCGALFGIGAVTRQARWKTIASILMAWITTLPLAAALGALCFLITGSGE